MPFILYYKDDFSGQDEAQIRPASGPDVGMCMKKWSIVSVSLGTMTRLALTIANKQHNSSMKEAHTMCEHLNFAKILETKALYQPAHWSFATSIDIGVAHLMKTSVDEVF